MMAQQDGPLAVPDSSQHSSESPPLQHPSVSDNKQRLSLLRLSLRLRQKDSFQSLPHLGALSSSAANTC